MQTTLNDMDEEADELVDVAVATGTGLSWDIPGKEKGVLVSHYALEEEGKMQCGVNWFCLGNDFGHKYDLKTQASPNNQGTKNNNSSVF